MLNAKVHELLNQQINKEFYSAYLYLEFSNYFKANDLDGFANWYMVQAQEERDHAMLFYTYLQNENMPVTLEAIDKPEKTLNCHMDVLQAGLEHERYVTSLINDIYGAAYDVRDFRTIRSGVHIHSSANASRDAVSKLESRKIALGRISRKRGKRVSGGCYYSLTDKSCLIQLFRENYDSVELSIGKQNVAPLSDKYVFLICPVKKIQNVAKLGFTSGKDSKSSDTAYFESRIA